MIYQKHPLEKKKKTDVQPGASVTSKDVNDQKNAATESGTSTNAQKTKIIKKPQCPPPKKKTQKAIKSIKNKSFSHESDQESFESDDSIDNYEKVAKHYK